MKYKTPRDFKAALEARVKNRARDRGTTVDRVRQLIIFDRFLKRAYEACPDALILKGGLVMELRLRQARTTVDIDARATGDLAEIVFALREHLAPLGSDFLSFEVLEQSDLSEMVGEQIVYGGQRLRIHARLANRPYGNPFFFDLALADAMVLPPEELPGDDLFEFIDAKPLIHRVYPPETHLAEKLHALTFPRPPDRPNSRAKDLIDVGLLCSHIPFEAGPARRSLEATFQCRDTHAIPTVLPEPPDQWTRLYTKIKRRDGLRWEDVAELFLLASRFANPLLANTATERWDPTVLTWSD